MALGKKARKLGRKTERKIKESLRPPERGMAPPPPATARGAQPPVELPPSAMAEPAYSESALAAQRTPREKRKKRSLLKKKTIKQMHVEINRRVAAVGEHGVTMADPGVPDHEKFVILGRQTGNIGDTLAGQPAPELVHRELIRVMALTGLWAQSLPRRGK